MKRALGLALAAPMLLPAGTMASEVSTEEWCKTFYSLTRTYWLGDAYSDEAVEDAYNAVAEPDIIACQSALNMLEADGVQAASGLAEAAADGAPASQETPQASPIPVPESLAASEFKTLGKRKWRQLVKSPDKYTGNQYKVWACITQFDSSTGDAAFRANATYKRQKEWYLDTANAFFFGDADTLEPFVADDIVSMDVIAQGSLSYESLLGEMTAPQFEVVSIKQAKGSCGL